ncbi:hypothetical protein OIU74_017599 [Salix koriyanagi]|uniref:F-box protein n=1 Tax=Salix koriyanagi TaxID=2511006 RepID=A0A9Q0WRH4_9ROSI|nr:hypothetical protein OIU74_017599 [Salix koriyanagi]
MKQITWPGRSDGSRFKSLPIKNQFHQSEFKSTSKFWSAPSASRKTRSSDGDFSKLPFDILTKIAASFTLPNLQAASLACKSWSEGLRPLREAMLFLKWGKRFKHGLGGVRPNLNKALESFLKGAARGSTLAMVDAALLYWEIGSKDKAIALYEKAAKLGDPAGQCNLGLAYLQGSGVNCNLQGAARWYLKAAEGGYVRAMYNVGLCYSVGEGQAVDEEGEKMKAVVYLELATRAGETAAAHVKNVIFTTTISNFT